jgi:Tfp pilus assembly protein PilF
MTLRRLFRLNLRSPLCTVPRLLSALLLAACATPHAPSQPVPAAVSQPVAPEPTVNQVYEALKAGHVEQAQQMISEVLRGHPKSAKAHYVAAWVYASGGDVERGKQELKTAEELDPSVSFANLDAIQHLRQKLQGERLGE